MIAGGARGVFEVFAGRDSGRGLFGVVLSCVFSWGYSNCDNFVFFSQKGVDLLFVLDKIILLSNGRKPSRYRAETTRTGNFESCKKNCELRNF